MKDQKNNFRLYNNVGLLQHWLALAVNSANDANTDTEKGEIKGSIHPFVPDFMIFFFFKFIFQKTDLQHCSNSSKSERSVENVFSIQSFSFMFLHHLLSRRFLLHRKKKSLSIFSTLSKKKLKQIFIMTPSYFQSKTKSK